jgi:hypothetical protein
MLGENRIRGRELRHLSALSSIEWLDLYGCPLNDPDLKSLEPLFSGLGPGKWLMLQNTRVTDADLAKISGFTNLVGVGLDDNGISDDGLPHLYSLKTLQDISLQRTRVTASGVTKLKQAIPSLNVEWDEGKPATVSEE